MCRVKRWMFFHPNDGTVPYPSNDGDNQILWERIQELETIVERRNNQIDQLNNQLQEYQGRVLPQTFITVRDEQRIDRSMVEQFENTQAYFEHMRRDQARRIVNKLLEEELIEHTFRPEEPGGDYYSRMILRVRNNIQ